MAGRGCRCCGLYDVPLDEYGVCDGCRAWPENDEDREDIEDGRDYGE